MHLFHLIVVGRQGGQCGADVLHQQGLSLHERFAVAGTPLSEQIDAFVTFHLAAVADADVLQLG
jgi:hypothetical protein